MTKKIALIFGITGQDGSHLADLLIKKKYKVIGVKRRSSSFNTKRIDHIYDKSHLKKKFHVFYGDLLDGTSLFNIIEETKPDEIYNLAAQSHVRTSFDVPEYTTDVNASGTLRILEAIRRLKTKKKSNFIKPQPLKFLEIPIFHKMKKLLLDLEVLMRYLNFMHTGQQ